MTGITRRNSLVLGAAALGASGLPIIGARAQDAAVTDVPTADVKPPEFKIEKGASLKLVRPAKFVDPDQVWFDKNTKAFTQQTGIPVQVSYISWEDVSRPRQQRSQIPAPVPTLSSGSPFLPSSTSRSSCRWTTWRTISARNMVVGTILR
jgi:hypothetical protein